MKLFAQLVLAVFLLISIDSFAQIDEDLMDLQVDVVYLASDLLEGRETGTKGEALAAQYIAKRFQDIGLTPKGNPGSWYHEFDFKYMPNPHGDPNDAEDRTGKNVVAYLDNGASFTVVIGAHYDHLGMGEFGSRHTGEPAIHNGADDNASGVAAMLYLAEALKEGAYKNNNYLFIAFSGEELGLFGSMNYVDAPTVPLAEMNYLINMDMIGRLNQDKVLAINGAGTSPSWRPTLENLKVADIKVKLHDSGIGPSDHTSFYNEGIPVLHFFSGQHTDYHKPEDDSRLVNYQGIYDISQFVLALIAELDDKGKLAYAKTKDDSEDRKVSKFKVTLGVMPDYVYDGTGMRIDGIIEDRPAQKAKLEKGDVIIKMGDLEVKDIYDYMKGLSMFEPGQEVMVTVKRGKKEVKRKVRF